MHAPTETRYTTVASYIAAHTRMHGAAIRVSVPIPYAYGTAHTRMGTHTCMGRSIRV